MNVIISTAQLAAALKRASRCVGNGRSGHPILACVLLTATADDRLTVAGFDLQSSISLDLPTAVTTPGAVAVNAQTITDLVSALPDQFPLSLKLNDTGDKLLLDCISSFYSIAAEHASDYPELPQPKPNDSTCAINSQAFLDACRYARTIASGDESKGIICGVSIRLNDAGGYQIAATDGHRLVQFGSISDHTAEAIVPARTLQQLERFDLHDTLTIVVSTGTVFFLVEGQVLSGRTYDGTYPNYPALFPVSFEGSFGIGRQVLKAAAARASIIARNGNDVLHLTPDHDTGTLTIATSNDLGQANETVSLEDSSKAHAFAVNAVYLQQALDAFVHAVVTFSTNSATTPVVIEPSDPDKQVQPVRVLIMPVQVRTEAPAAAPAAKPSGKRKTES